MSEQRQRFEAAWREAVLPGLPMPRNGDGYSLAADHAAWRAFQLGEASGMERAAKVCDDIAYDESGYCIDPDTAQLGETIRALMARGGE